MSNGKHRKGLRVLRSLKAAATCFALLCLPLLSWAGANTGAAFLKIPVGARAVGMGSAFTAEANDVSAIYWNPGGLAGLSRKEFGGTHTELYQDMKYDFMGYAHPSRQGTWAASLAYLSMGSIEGRGENGERLSDFTASDMVFSFAFSQKINPGIPLGVGASFKFIQSRIAESRAETFAFDMGAIYQTVFSNKSRMSFGIAVQNIGPGLRFISQDTPLPLTLATGLSYRLPAGLALTMDIKYEPLDKRTNFSVGTEYSLFSGFCLRAGYLASVARGLREPQGDSKKLLEQVKGLGVGLGLRFSRFSVDYAFTPFGELGNAQRVGLSARF